MRTTKLDLTPLYRSAIGIDRMAHLLDSAYNDAKPGYPPYNVELVEENQYRITMALAGFSESEIDITSEQNTLTVNGKQDADESKQFLYQGIAARNFERTFQLAEHVSVVAARLENGLLFIDLEREIPEAMKPRKIAVNGYERPSLSTSTKAA
ncbi:MAG: molecular chaperone IbpA [Halieaceae bacterium]|jgi:molecular chaperone IbpA